MDIAAGLRKQGANVNGSDKGYPEAAFVKNEKLSYEELTLSRIAWYVFPLLTLIFLFFVLILVITPIKKIKP